MSLDAVTTVVAVCIAFFSLAVAFGQMAQSRHAAIRYKAENKDDEEQRRDKQTRVFDVILGVPGISASLNDRLYNMDQRSARVELNVHDIQKELHPNGGNSMRDDLTRTRLLAEQAAAEAKRVATALAKNG